MQEIRMTFGEHLEELRKRILVSLLYLVVGVALALVYEKELMSLALGPHQRAFSSAQKTRLLIRLERLLEGVEPLTSAYPHQAMLDDKPLVVGVPVWEVLFTADVAAREALSGLTRPFEAAGDDVLEALSSLPAAEREALRAAFLKMGDGLAREIAGEFAPRQAVESDSDVPRMFARLERELRDFQAKNQERGLTEIISWGDELEEQIARIAKLNAYIERQRRQVVDSEISLEDIQARGRESGLTAALLDVHNRVSAIFVDMKKAHRAEIMVISYLEQFYTHLKVAALFGLLFSIPFVLYEMWKFVGAGLYIHEQRYVVTFLPFSLALFVAGAFFGYQVLIPVALTFLAGWGDADIQLGFTLGNYIGLFFTLTLVLGLVFQTPLIMVFLLKIHVATVQTFRKYRRLAIMIGVILSAVLTPPDPISLGLMALPMVLLYEFGILVCQLLSPRKGAIQENKEQSA